MTRRLLHLIFACSLCGSVLPGLAKASGEEHPRPRVNRILDSPQGRFWVGVDESSRLPRRVSLLDQAPRQRGGPPLTARERARRFLHEHRRLLFGTDDIDIDESGIDENGIGENGIDQNGIDRSGAGPSPRGRASSNGRVSIHHERSRRDKGVVHLWQRPYIDGIPILDGWVQIHVDAAGNILALQSRYRELSELPDTRAGLGPEQALARALAAIDRPGQAQIEPTAELGLIEFSGELRLVYRTMHALYSPYGDWESLVDAHTGEVLSTVDRIIRCKPHDGKRIDLQPHGATRSTLPGVDAKAEPTAPRGLVTTTGGAPRDLSKSSSMSKATGTGLVLPANPLNGEPTRYDLRDGDDVDIYRESVAIKNLDGSGFLRGSWVDVYRNSGGSRTQEGLFDYSYSSSDSASAFHEANVYWHIDVFQDYVKNTLGVDGANDRQQVVYAHELQADQSDFQPSTKVIRLGDGGVDDAEDGEIVLHEYGHAVHDDIIPFWLHTGQTGSIGEGFGDYLAASFGDNPLVGEWDATSYNACPPPGDPCEPYLRRIDLPNVYPDDYSAPSGIYYNSAIISGAWWDLREALGKELADTIIISAFHYMPFNPDFRDAVDGAIFADRAIHGGANVDTIYHTFADRGLFPKVAARVASNLVAVMDAERVLLSWELFLEQGLIGIQLERRVDDGEYAPLLDQLLLPEVGRMTAVDPATNVLPGQLLSYRLVGRFEDGSEEIVDGVETSLSFTPPRPTQLVLEQNYPNPFNPSTTIRFALPQTGFASLRVYDSAGRLVRILVEEPLDAREYKYVWDGRDQAGAQVSSGLYTYQLRSASQQSSRRMVLIK